MQITQQVLILEIRKTINGEQVLQQYIPETNEPKFDELPSETLKQGSRYTVTYTPITPEPDPEFNKSVKKKSKPD